MSDLFSTVYRMVCFVGFAALVVMLFQPRLRATFERRCVGSATAIDLAFIRIVACATLFLYALTEDLPSYAQLPTEWYAPPGHTEWLGRELFDWFLSSAARLHGLTWILLAALGLAMVGCATRVTVPLAAILYLLFAALLRSFGKQFHEGYLGFYVLVVLCFLPCGDAWSVDARWLSPLWRRFRRRPAAEPAASCSWAVYACYAAAALPYLQLGMSKLISGGLFWFDGRSLRNYLLTDNLNLTEFEIDLALRFYDAPVIAFTIAGFFALLTELSYPLVLVSPRLRRFLPACVALLHVGVWCGQDALFLDAILIPAIFVRPSRWLTRSPAHAAGDPDRLEPAEPLAAAPEPLRSRRIRSWLRGPHVPIGFIAVMIFLQYSVYRTGSRWEWPVVLWTMYAEKGSTSPAVAYRRFLAEYPDGRQVPIRLGDTIAFLHKPSRLDRGLNRNQPAFLIACLGALRKQDSQVVGLVFERRSWKFEKRSLAKHLQKDQPRRAYRVLQVEGPPADLRLVSTSATNLVVNDGFTAWGKKGDPRDWEVEGTAYGIGLDPAGGRMALLSSSPKARSLSQDVALPDALVGKTVALRASVLAHAAAADAALELEIRRPGQATEVLRAPVPGDRRWHRIALDQPAAPLPKGTVVHVVLRAPPGADAMFDDVRLAAEPAP